MLCYICQNEVYIPVEVTCFPCYERNKINCFTYVRLCVSCVIPYLQLNKAIEDRTCVKCLFCSEKVDTKILTTQNSFVFDFIQIREKQLLEGMCPFCFKMIQDNIVEHIKEECCNYYHQCICGRVTTREWLSLHQRYCSEYEECPLCKKVLEKKQFELHCFEEHDLLLCDKCNQYVKINDFSFHTNYQCSQRLISCNFCNERIPFPLYENHLIEHEKEIQNVLESIREMSFRLYRKFSDIQKKRAELFHNFYLES